MEIDSLGGAQNMINGYVCTHLACKDLHRLVKSGLFLVKYEIFSEIVFQKKIITRHIGIVTFASYFRFSF